MTLRPKQEAAARRMGQDVCVVAGPGSGKTGVLVERFRWLAAERGVSPLRILAITFTDKAANEIRRRLAGKFADMPELREQVERAYVCTIHGLCSRLLREHPIPAGVDPGFAVLDAPAADRQLEQAAHKALDAVYRRQPAQFRKLLDAIYVSTRPGGRQADLAKAVINVYEALRTYGKSIGEVRKESEAMAVAVALENFVRDLRCLLASAPAKRTQKQGECIDALWEWCGRAGTAAASFNLLSDYPPGLPSRMLSPDLRLMRDEQLPLVKAAVASEHFAPLKALLLDSVELTGELYGERKRAIGGLDFADLEEKTIELLRAHPDVLDSVRRRFEYVLMDEMQDTNPLQWVLIGLLRMPQRFFAVGDINQSIYGFRFAEPEVFRQYRESIENTGQKVDELDENHRSRAEILAAVDAVLGGRARGVENGCMEARRIFAVKDSPSVEVIIGAGDKPVEMEAEWIARRIRELAGNLVIQDSRGVQRAVGFRDIAILVRNTNTLDAIKEALDRHGVPHLHTGGKTFYESREVRDLVHLLRVIADPGDEVSRAVVLRSPLVGVGDETLLRLKLSGGTEAGDAEEESRLRRFNALAARLRAMCEDVSPDRLLTRAMDACDYEGRLTSRERANVDKLLTLLRNWHRSRPGPFSQLIADLEWLRESASEAEAPPEEAADAVRVMSIHQAKGLEFPVVFVAALDRGVSNGTSPICLARDGGLGVCWRNPVDGTQARDLIHLKHGDEVKIRAGEEEDRLLYVAMTRAEEHLVLSWAETDRPQGKHWELVKEGLHIGQPDEPPVAVRVLRGEQAPEVMELPPMREGEADEPLVLARPARGAQYDSTVQVTALALFAQNPQRYYLERYIGRESAETGWSGDGGEGRPNAAEFGSLVHAMLAGELRPEAPKEARELVERFHASDLGRRAARADRVEREFDFVMSIEDVVLRGQIDLWFEEGGELILADYKTDSVTETEAAGRAAKYSLQVRLYALALQRFTGRRPDRAFVCLLKCGVAVPVELDASFTEEAAALVGELKNAQAGLQFEPRAKQEG